MQRTDVLDGPSLGPAHTVPPNHRVPSFLAFRFYQVCLGMMAEVLASEGLKVPEYGALTMLDLIPGLDQQSLATSLGLDKVSVGKMIDRLELAELVERRIDPTNRRSRRLHLTATGLRLRQRLQPAALAAQNRILGPLETDERPVFLEMMTRLIERHGRYARPGNGRNPPSRRAAQPAESVNVP